MQENKLMENILFISQHTWGNNICRFYSLFTVVLGIRYCHVCCHLSPKILNISLFPNIFLVPKEEFWFCKSHSVANLQPIWIIPSTRTRIGCPFVIQIGNSNHACPYIIDGINTTPLFPTLSAHKAGSSTPHSQRD